MTRLSLSPWCLLALVAGCSADMMGHGGGPTPGPFGAASGTSATSGTSGSVGVSTTTTGGPIPSTYLDKPVITSKSLVPPVSGGTLLALSKSHRAVVADPDRDQIVVVDTDQVTVTAAIALQKGDEPGRLAEDGAGLVHVVLRGAGAVVTIDPALGREVSRQTVCANPRGIAYDAATNLLHVACSGGQLLSLAPTGGAPTRQLRLDSDLRDVVVDGPRLFVSRFRSAQVLVVEADGTISARLTPSGIAPNPNPGSGPPEFAGKEAFAPSVAWRMVAAPGGGVLLAFQEEQTTEIIAQPGGYGGPCGGIVRSGVALLRTDNTGWTTTSSFAVLPVDIAAGPYGNISVASAGMGGSQFSFISPVVTVTPGTPGQTLINDPKQSCSPPGDQSQTVRPDGQVVAIAYDASNRLIVQTREPMLVVGNRAVILPGEAVRDTGHEIFHESTSAGLACASCHPEGREDGHVWTFATLGARRTQSLGGGVLGTGPFHWTGDMKDFPMLSEVVFTGRMSGAKLRPEHVGALSGWLDRVPAWHAEAATDPSAADRGRALFADAAVGCATCHAGPTMTTHMILDVGSGGAFKIPSLLGVGFRVPLMHNGCASSLADRFGACGGSSTLHGNVSSLTGNQLGDLVAYLETL